MKKDVLTATSIAILASPETEGALLQSIVEVARAIFAARATSIFLVDDEAQELVFRAVAGEGEGALIGRRFPAHRGIAGWVLTTQQPLVIEDLSTDPRFAHDLAQSTGFIPRSLMAAPLLDGQDVLGVLEVLDKCATSQERLGDVELMGLFVKQAAVALNLTRRARIASQVLTEEGGELRPLLAVVDALQKNYDDRKRKAGLQLLQSVAELLQ